MQTIVGVLRGGPSHEHQVSLKTGASMLIGLPENRFTARDIYIDKNGVWYERGRPTTPERMLRQIDVALIGLHGEFGEDGQVQKMLDQFGIKYAGSDPFGSYLAMHKVMAKKRAEQAGLKTPDFLFIPSADKAEEGARNIIRSFRQPVVVKPVGWGSSIGVSIVGGYAPVESAISALFASGAQGVLVEEYIRGTDATVGVVENLRGEPLYALPPVEIIPPQNDFYSFNAKFSPATLRKVPSNFSRVATEELARAAKLMHRSLGLKHYSRSDFIVAPSGVYYLETNSLPALADNTDLPVALASVGVSRADFLSHLVNLALSR